MIRKASDCPVETREKMRDGNGSVVLTNFATKDELLNKCRLYERLTFAPGCSIGYHVHENETEIFVVECGTAEYSDNGTMVTLQKGDITVTPPGDGHSIKNIGSDTMSVIALIVTA